ncbi:sugar-phosphatase [Thorsellia anophelis]|uniref:Sugar-phosphatase n=1 Tax=Thorsellia anophelis DSM 18579 TaxID=1123402 RepID=A0A1H9Y9A0_9GAMM|nr:sugar-phosphatase [Thorsellia anophelis]SES65013.1 hypothetical protein SAMN02583745_00111 [Thorsellia anophelis DSM 18579]
MNIKKHIKLIALDLDGTLLNSSHELSDDNIQAINEAKEQGIKVVLVTGRPFIGTQKFTKQLNMMSDSDYVIVCNGALIMTPNSGEVILENTLNIDDYYYLETLARELGVHFQVFDQNSVYTANRDIGKYTVLESWLTGIPLKFRTREEMPKSMRFPKMMMVDEQDILDNAIAKLPKSIYEQFNVIKSSPNFLEIIAKNVDKGAALKSLANKLNIAQENVMAIGDQGNDISMISYAGFGIAMENAIDELKDIADALTDHHDNNGVANAIRKWALA